MHELSRCVRCAEPLTAGASYCASCGARQPSTVAPYAAPQPARRPAWLPIAIGIGAVAAVAGGALLAVALSSSPVGDGTPSASPSSSAAVGPSGAAQSSSQAPTPSPSIEAAEVIPNRAIATVAFGGGAILRTSATTSADAVGTLSEGRRLFVIGAPTEADDLRWYRVAPLHDADGACDSSCGKVGWVATPIAAEDEPWVEESPPECPAPQMTAETLGAMDPLEALSCYGRSQIEVTGTVATAPVVDTFLRYSPAWLADPNVPVTLNGGDLTQLGFRASPESELEPPEPGASVRVTGHFEDPAATSCRVSVEEGGDPASAPSGASVVLACRATFVWDDYELAD